MPRLIDADALVRMNWVLPNRTARETALECFRNIVNEAPTIDAVEVVRCKDCVLWKPVGKHTGKCPFLIGENQYTGDDHYCSLGERREENAAVD